MNVVAKTEPAICSERKYSRICADYTHDEAMRAAALCSVGDVMPNMELVSKSQTFTMPLNAFGFIEMVDEVVKLRPVWV